MADPKRGVAETAKVFTHGGSPRAATPANGRRMDRVLGGRVDGLSLIDWGVSSDILSTAEVARRVAVAR